MKRWITCIALVAVASGQTPPDAIPAPTVKANVEEVVLDIVVRDKKGKPVTNLKPEELSVADNGSKQTLTSFRLVSGSEAISQSGAPTKLDPLRQVRLVTLAFDAMGAADARKTARTAAIDLISGEQGTNVFYAVMVINTRLLVLQSFTKDKDALTKAIERATNGMAAGGLLSESENIRSELKRTLNGQTVNGADQDVNLTAAATEKANPAAGNRPPSEGGSQFVDAKLASVMLDMLRMDSAVVGQGTRLSIEALEALVKGLQGMPGRKSVLYFTQGLYVTPELDVPFRNVMGMANRANVTFYAVDARGVLTASQNGGATRQLNGAAAASRSTVNRTAGAVTKEEVMSSDNAEVSARANVQSTIRDLAESTGGFLIGDSNDLRGPLRRVNEEISSYYEVTYRPAIQSYDGTFRKLAVTPVGRKDLVIHARNGYFALPAEARVSGLQTFETPLLAALSSGANTADVEFRAGAVILRPKVDGTDVSVLVEVPLRGLQPQTDTATKTSIHFSLDALVKDAKGDVVQKVARDRSVQVTPDQLKMGNFIEKATIVVPVGKYSLESAVMDRENGKIGIQRSEFTVAPKTDGVGISSLSAVRSFAPNVKDLDPNEPFQYQGGTITPTLDTRVAKTANSALRLFFTVYPSAANSAKPTVEIEVLQNGKVLQKVPLPLPDADAQSRIPYVMTIPAAAIPAGTYEFRATARQGDTVSQTKTSVIIEGK